MSTLIPQLSRKAWIIVGANGISALGNGMLIPFLVIYLRDARDFPIEQAGLMLSTVAVSGLVAAPTTGWLIDKVGSRRMLMFSLVAATVAALGLAFVDELWEGYAWAVLFGASVSSMWPATHSLMASVVRPDQRAAVYSVHFALLNAGIGLGAVIGGVLVKAALVCGGATLYSFRLSRFIPVRAQRFALAGAEVEPLP